jgi:hypothetical protein
MLARLQNFFLAIQPSSLRCWPCFPQHDLRRSNTSGLAQMIRAGENPCPSRRAVRQLAGSLEVHQLGRGWEVLQPWLRGCQREGCSAGLRQRRLVDQRVNANGHNAKDFRVRTLAEPDRRRDAIGRHQRHPGWPTEFFLSADENVGVLARPLLLKFLPDCLQDTGLAPGPFNRVGGLADCLQ